MRREISDRVRVWSEPEVVDSAHFEFAETEEFLKAAEAITGCPYMWQRSVAYPSTQWCICFPLFCFCLSDDDHFSFELF